MSFLTNRLVKKSPVEKGIGKIQRHFEYFSKSVTKSLRRQAKELLLDQAPAGITVVTEPAPQFFSTEEVNNMSVLQLGEFYTSSTGRRFIPHYSKKFENQVLGLKNSLGKEHAVIASIKDTIDWSNVYGNSFYTILTTTDERKFVIDWRANKMYTMERFIEVPDKTFTDAEIKQAIAHATLLIEGTHYIQQ